MYGDLDRVLFEAEEIAARLDGLAAQITADYQGLDLTVIAILNGSLIFMADLLRRIPLPLQLDCLRVCSYYGGMVSTGQVTFDPQTLPDLTNRHVLLLDDILDSGHTLAAIVETMHQQVKPLSLRSCVLLRKIKLRARPIEADYVGFDIQDEFVVGYGLDYKEKYRNLSVIGVLRQE
ncbi:MAG TPA: hypoxanthine phosphoribosyltransferase [Chthoniobacterales bacterium]|jgi:hypoxanthine phosphoribosyltransferase|nr:hypoxanthine phosphoribosyltransferase [Chthoniobacterales bacterium]